MTRRVNATLPALAVVMLAGVALRLAFLLVSHPHVDEYSSIWAAMRVWQTGVPVLPPGFPYLQGVLFTYIDAPFVGAFPFSEALARMPSLFAGAATIALVFLWGRSAFGSFAGLLAATLVAFESASIIWSGRARMYALQQMLLTLALYAFFRGVLDEPDRRACGIWRWVFGLAFAGALLSQATTVLVVPGLVLALLMARDRLELHRAGARVLLLSLLAAVGLAVALNALGGPVSDASERAFIDPSLPWRLKPDMFFREFFWGWPDWLRTVPILLGAAWLLATIRKSAVNLRLACLVVLVFGSLLPMIFLVGESWQRPRYLIMLLPVADLLAGAVIAGLGRWVGLSPGRRLATPLGAAIWIGLVIAFLPTAWATVGPAEPAYDLAYRYVSERIAPGDALLSPLPSISAVYTGRSDGYTLQNGYEEYLVTGSDGPVDRWTGSTLIDSVPKLEERFPAGRRVWLVVDDVRWRERYDDEFRSYVERTMHPAFREGGVTVYERPGEEATKLTTVR